VLDLDTGMEGCRFSVGVRNAHDKSLGIIHSVHLFCRRYQRKKHG
jgi:hypothetical protein